jgi:hypothetical protein
MMRKDLQAARGKWIEEATSDAERKRREASDFLTYQDEDGLFADFHSHRHTFISNLGKAGVPLSIAQKLARHCDPIDPCVANDRARPRRQPLFRLLA